MIFWYKKNTIWKWLINESSKINLFIYTCSYELLNQCLSLFCFFTKYKAQFYTKSSWDILMKKNYF